MRKELEDIGLSEKEARVYLAALELGPTTAEKLSTYAKVNRSTTYVQLESLMKQGLVSTYEEGKKTIFAPEPPESLKRTLELKEVEFESKKKELESILPELTRLFESAGDRPVVRFFNGKEGITAMREDTLTLPKGSEILVIYSYDALFTLYTEAEADVYVQKRAKRGLQIRSIYTRSAGKLDPDGAPMVNKRYIPANRMPLNSDFFIYGNKVAIMALRGKAFGVVIESKEVADSFRTFFKLIWTLGEE